jgi:hypothetical protein
MEVQAGLGALWGILSWNRGQFGLRLENWWWLELSHLKSWLQAQWRAIWTYRVRLPKIGSCAYNTNSWSQAKAIRLTSVLSINKYGSITWNCLRGANRLNRWEPLCPCSDAISRSTFFWTWDWAKGKTGLNVLGRGNSRKADLTERNSLLQWRSISTHRQWGSNAFHRLRSPKVFPALLETRFH